MSGEDVKARARELRANLSPPERRLWAYLRRCKGPGWHFRKQSAFGDFVLDFVCHSRRLVIEVDGHHHADERRQECDFVRDKILQREGYRVLRIPAGAVMGDIGGVMDGIQRVLGEQASIHRAASPRSSPR